jgi:hypothetical protein
MGKRFLHNDSCFWFSDYWFSINRFDNDEFWKKEVIKNTKKGTRGVPFFINLTKTL